MIDTVVLTLSQSSYVILEHDNFEPSTRNLFDENIRLGSRGYVIHKQNPTKIELKNGIYKPRLSVTKRFNDGLFERPLKIEFSVPKLLYKNNFDEVVDEDFENITEILHKTLKDMGVYLFSIDNLIYAPVSSIHYSKNIQLFDGLTSLYVLKEIKKANVTQRLDFNQSDFRNEGHSIKYHTNSFEIALYDKVKDFLQSKISEKRAIEKDNILQMNLFKEIEQIRKVSPLEILRLEIRLNKRQKIRQILKNLGFEIEPTFKNLFRKAISKSVQLHFIDEIEKQYPKADCLGVSNIDFLSQFMIDNPKIRATDTLSALGYCKFLEDNGLRELKELFLKKYSRNTCLRLMQELNSHKYPSNPIDIFKSIRESIEAFEPLKLVDFEAKMLNNDKYS